MRYYEDPKPLEEMTDEEMVAFHIRCQEDFHYFNEVVLGHHDMNEEHKDGCEFIQHDEAKNKMVLWPRYTFKSSVVTQGLCLWWMIRNPNIRMLIYSDTFKKSQGFLRGIKNHIEGKAGRSRFRDLMGPYETHYLKGVWTDNRIEINRRTEAHVEPTVDTAGIEQSKVGMHYDLIIFDDIVSKVNVTTKDQMDKVHECYQESLALLKPGGLIYIVGTRWHFGDMYGRIIAENKEFKNFGIMLKDADAKNEEGELIFANIGLNEEHLTGLKNRMGSYTYSCLMRNNPIDSDQTLFKYESFKFYGEKMEPKDLYITCCIDPSGEGDDPTGGTVVGTDNQMNMYILEVLNRKCPPDMIVDWVMSMNRKYRLNRLGIETIFFRGLLERELQRRITIEREKDKDFNMFGIEKFSPSARRGETKFVRIQALQPFHERGEIWFPGDCVETLKTGFSDLAFQMLQVTPTHMPNPNDVLDSLAYHIPILCKGGSPKKAKLPTRSPAKLEKEWIANHNRMQRRLPRHKRRKYKAVLS